MKWSGEGLCAVLSSSLLSVCALSELVAGFRCVSLGSAVRAHFQLTGSAAGAFYSGLLLLLGQLLLGSALLCCRDRPSCRNLSLLGVVVFLLGVLTAFSGAVVDGDTAALVDRKFSHYCLRSTPITRECEQLRDYQRTLVISAVLSTLECFFGLINLLVIQRCRRAQASRSRQAQREIILNEERDCSSADLQPVSYINLALFNVCEEAGAEAQCGGHPSRELPGFSLSDPELNLCFPFSYPLPAELPPAYEDIFPAEESTT